MDREAWQMTLYGLTKSRTPLSDFHLHFGTQRNDSQNKNVSIFEVKPPEH